MNNKTGLLVGIGAAAEYLQVSCPTIRKYLKMGMPAFYISSDSGKGGTWHFYRENIEDWWKKKTAVVFKDIDKFIDQDEADL